MIDLEERLTRHLRGEADAMVVPAVGARAVVERARRRFARRRAVAAVVTVGVVTTSVVAVAHRPTPKDRIEVKVTGSSTPDASGPAVLVPSALHWRAATSTGTLIGARVHRHDGGLYALSTAPGQAPTDRPPTLSAYSSTDGISWAALDLGDRWIGDIDGRDGHVYAVGTAAATAPVDPKTHTGDAVVLRSDGGAWKTSVLPVDLRAMAKKGMLNVYGGSVAAGPRGVLVALNIASSVDVSKFLPPGAMNDRVLTYTSSGIDLFASPAPTTTCGAQCTSSISMAPENGPVVASYTYAQLGIDSDLAAALRGLPRFFFSADGIAFSPVELPLPAAAGFAQMTASADDGGYLVTMATPHNGEMSLTLLSSVDGLNWTTVETMGNKGIAAIGLLGGQQAAIAGIEAPSLVRFGGPSGTTSTDLGPIVREAVGGDSFVSSATFGPTGAAFVAVPMSSPQPGVATTTTVKTSSVTSATTVEVTDTGPAVPTTALFAQVQKLVLFESPDGVHWSATDIGQQVGTPIVGASVVATDMSFVVTATLPGTRLDQPAAQKVLVATR